MKDKDTKDKDTKDKDTKDKYTNDKYTNDKYTNDKDTNINKIDIYPEKAQFLRGENIVFILEMEGEAETEGKIESEVETEGKIESEVETEIESKIETLTENMMLNIYHLDKLLVQKNITVVKGFHKIVLPGIDKGFSGYGAELVSITGKNILASTAFDVVDKAEESIRYGFLCNFTTKDGENHKDLDFMAKFHINFVQFYDWSYRHDQLVSMEPVYKDMMGKVIDRSVVKNKIEYGKTKGQKSMAYGAVYAASEEYYIQHKNQGLYNGNDEIITFIDTFYIMNIHEKNPWHDHIIEQYKKAVTEMGFSGIHMDTYGFPKEAYGVTTSDEKLFMKDSDAKNSDMGDFDIKDFDIKESDEKEKIYLKDQFGPLINHTKEELDKIKEENYLIFNNVGNWPVKTVAGSKQAAMYIEVWNPYERYFHIIQIIKEAQLASNFSKPVVLAAYLEPFRLDSIERAGYAAQLLTAIIVSEGAYHLLFGEENGVLTQGYYVDHSQLTVDQIGTMRRYYDFMIRYMNLFYDSSLEDVSMTHMGWDNYEYAIEGNKCSTYGESDKICCVLRQNNLYKTISLINLCGQNEDYWNKGKSVPEKQKNIKVRVHVDQKIQNIYVASPDQESGKSIQLDYVYLNNNKGIFVEFTVPELEFWSLIYIEM